MALLFLPHCPLAVFCSRGQHLRRTPGGSTLSGFFDSGAAASCHLSICHLMSREHIALVSVALFPLSTLWSQRLCSGAISPSECPKATPQCAICHSSLTTALLSFCVYSFKIHLLRNSQAIQDCFGVRGFRVGKKDFDLNETWQMYEL